MALFLFLVAFYVFLQLGCIDLCLSLLPGCEACGPAGLALRLARGLGRRLVGVTLVQGRPAGVAAGDAQGLLQFAVGHVGGVGGGFAGRFAGQAGE